MKNQNVKFLRSIGLVLFVVMMLSSCEDALGTTNKRVDALEKRVAQLEQQGRPTKGSAPTITSPTSAPSTTVPTPTTTISPEVERFEKRLAQLEAMSDADCARITDPYLFLELPGASTEKDGSFWHYDCTTGEYGWYFQGSKQDHWTHKSIDPTLIPLGEVDDVRLPLDISGSPLDRHHPHYPNALTGADIKAGVTICLRSPNVSGKEFANTVLVTSVFTHAVRDHSDGHILAWPAFTADPVSGDKAAVSNTVYAMSDFGLTPSSFNSTPYGLWGIKWVTAGAC